MPDVCGGLLTGESARRWSELARRQLVHYSELDRSGRWRHYFADRAGFEARLRDVIRAAEAWGALARAQPEPAVAADHELLAAD